jgi:quercetin dioxygenase-like cupin family protein
MGLINFEDTDHMVVPGYSQGRGAVLRAEGFEVTRISFAKGEGAKPHSHQQDQFTYILSGRLRVTIGDGEEVYEIGPGQATYNPTGVLHGVEAIEDTTALSFKAPLNDEEYEATGTLS